jgi:hypothetical protein
LLTPRARRSCAFTTVTAGPPAHGEATWSAAVAALPAGGVVLRGIVAGAAPSAQLALQASHERAFRSGRVWA